MIMDAYFNDDDEGTNISDSYTLPQSIVIRIPSRMFQYHLVEPLKDAIISFMRSMGTLYTQVFLIRIFVFFPLLKKQQKKQL